MQISLGKTLEYTFLTILTDKDWCFIQFSTGMAVWLLLIFLLCLHNQLSSIHSIISTDVWVSFCLNTGKRFFLEVSSSSQQK